MALTLSTWAAPAEDAAKVPAAPAQVSTQLQIQPADAKQSSEPVYAPAEGDLQVQPAVLLANANPEQAPGVVAVAVEGGAPLEGDLAASPDANPAEGEPGADLETANSFWRGYGGWGGYGGYGGWGYRPYYGGGWRHHGYGRGWGGGYGGWGGYRGGYGYWG